MTADRTIVIDGQTYNKGDEIPDMGSLTCISIDNGKREYRGLSADKDKLPTYDNLATGSSVLFVDTGTYMEYLAYNQTWYEI